MTNPSPAAASCGTVMSPLREVIALEVLLLPRGRVALPGADPDSKATWELLGRTWEADTALGFVRIELAGASWAALVPEERLARNERGVRVTVRRQSRPAPGAARRLGAVLLTPAGAVVSGRFQLELPDLPGRDARAVILALEWDRRPKEGARYARP